MAAYNIYEAKTSLSALVDKAAAGEEVVIARAGKPMVRMVPFETPKPAVAKPKYFRKAPGFAKGKWNDVLEELDKPWPEDLQRAFGMID
jgi:prevent-host-death family protein